MHANCTQEDVVNYNQKALKLMAEHSFILASEMLETLLPSFSQTTQPSLSEVMTLNNLSLIYQKCGKPYDSLTHLSRALNFLPSNELEFKHLAGTLLNLSSINSSLGFHQVSLQQAFKAFEISEKSNCLEVLALSYYNLASQLAYMEKPQQAKQYFKEGLNLCRSHLGANHKLTVLIARGHSMSMSSKNHIRVRSSGHTAKTSSLSNHPKPTRYSIYPSDFPEKLTENHTKINFSTKIAAIASAGRAMANKHLLVGAPYMKEIRTFKRIDAGIYATPKVSPNKAQSSMSQKTSIFNEPEDFLSHGKMKKRLKSIRAHIFNLETKLKEFVEESRSVMKIIENENHVAAALKIQRWYRKKYMKL